MRTLDIKLLRDLRRMWTQALSIAAITMVGTAAYIILIGTANSILVTQVNYYERQQFAYIFATAQYVPNFVAKRLEEINGVGKVTTGIAYTSVVNIQSMDQPATCQATTIPEEGDLNQLYIRSGRALTPHSRREVIVSEGFALVHNIQLGDFLNITMKGMGYRFQVVGIALSPEYVFFAVPGAMVPDDRLFGVLWFNREFLEEAYEIKGGFNKVSFSIIGDVNENDVITAVDAVLKPYGGTGAFPRADHISHSTINSQIEQLNATVKYAAPVFVGIVAFLLHMVMKRHIETEREQIGSFKAFGYSNTDIVLHYLKFVLVIVASGVAAGMLVGSKIGELATIPYARMFHFPYLEYVQEPLVFVQVAIIQVGAGLIGCLHSLHSAARLPPAVAMRPPPPPVYKRTWLEIMLQKVISDQPSRMIMRHIIRWPLRSLMTVFAIAGAMAVLVAPLGMLSSSERMVDIHFFEAERQDMTVAFGRTPSEYAAMDIKHLPGVLSAEPFRNVAARLEFGGKQRRVAVLGRRQGNELSRPLDANDDGIQVPKEGIVISVSMAEFLGARIGEYVTLRFLEGRKPVIEMPIVALAENYQGPTFFMTYVDAEVLNDILREGNVINGVYITHDPLYLKPFFKQLKGAPAMVAGITHAGALAALRRGMEGKTRMTYFYVLIAGIIIFGAVYNSARISLAERSRELAGMRLLGYTRSEVSYVLLGELAILTLAALPVGSGLGYALAYLLTEGSSNYVYRLPLYFKWSSIGYAVLVVMAMVAISGAFMAKRIFNLDLIATLKTKE